MGYNYNIPSLPLSSDIESRAILKKVASARSALAETKGVAKSVPNENILISTLSLQEARASSEIENIVTTQDNLYQSDFFAQQFRDIASKEVYNYTNALLQGYRSVKESGLLSLKQIVEIQAVLTENSAGFRKLAGTELKNDTTGETIYTPPQSYDEIVDYMSNLEKFINDDTISEIDPLVKLAIIHHQFESIHPFYDGNGRAGRIINILYLVKEGLLDNPILYLSRYINRHKGDYYALLQRVRTDNDWDSWIMFILEAIEKTARQTTIIINGIVSLMHSQKQKIRTELPRIYSQDLLNTLFKHPYTKIAFVERDLGVVRLTARSYLEKLSGIGVLDKYKIGRDNYYINSDLFTFLANVNEISV